MTYNLSKFATRKRIKDRGIKWKEAYEERSAPLKRRFDKEIGPGAYWRWRGHDYTSNSEYFIVVGPSIKRGVGKMFFAGIKKVKMEDLNEIGEASAYSPYGEYFPNIKAALSYASKKWGVKFPRNQAGYNTTSLAGVHVPEHIKA